MMGRVFMDALDDPFARIDDELAACPLGRAATPRSSTSTPRRPARNRRSAISSTGASASASARTPMRRPPTRAFSRGGTGFITDVGMTGDYDSVIGMDKDEPLRRFIAQFPPAASNRPTARRRSAASRWRPARTGWRGRSRRCGSAAAGAGRARLLERLSDGLRARWRSPHPGVRSRRHARGDRGRPDRRAQFRARRARASSRCRSRPRARCSAPAARALIQRGFARAGPRICRKAKLDALFADFLDHYNAHIADNSWLFPGVEACLDALRGGGLAAGGLHQQARAFLASAAGQARRRRQVPVRLRPGHVRRRQARSRGRWSRRSARSAASSAARSWSAIRVTDIETARAAGTPVIAVDFGYTDVPVAELGPDRVISHFDALFEAVEALARALT